MATKTLTITEEAYMRLAAQKRENESFSDIINRITQQGSLRDLVGLLSREEAEELQSNVNASRKDFNAEVEKRTRRMFP